MQTNNKFMDDMAKLATGAAGALHSVKGEMEEHFRAWLDRQLSSMDLVTREDFETVRAMAEKLVLIQGFGEVHFVARPAELGRLVQRLQEGLLVERRLRLDELVVDPLERPVLAEREGVVDRPVDRVVAVASRAVHVTDRVA